MTKGKRTNR